MASLDKWRAEEGIECMVLMGHSLGGYLSAVYALRHPERVQHLVLVCPAGVVSGPGGFLWIPGRFLMDSLIRAACQGLVWTSCCGAGEAT